MNKACYVIGGAFFAMCAFAEPSITNEPVIKFPPIEGNHVLVANSSQRVTKEMFDNFNNKMLPYIRIPTLYTNYVSQGCPMKDAKSLMKDPKVKALIMIVESDELPSVLTAPESAWVSFNPRQWCPEGTDAERFGQRVDKELWRCFGFVLGTANSSFPACVMKSVSSAKDLDNIKGKRLSPETFNKVIGHARFLGIERLTPIMPEVAATNTPAAK